MNRFVKTLTLGLLAISIAAPSNAEGRKRWKKLYSNVTQEDMGALFSGVAHVGFSGATQKDGDTHKDALAVSWYDRNGAAYHCRVTNEDKWEIGSDKFKAVTIDKSRQKIKYPLLKFGKTAKTGYRLPIYAANGNTGLYIFWKGFWWESEIGHLQARLPAATWTACPDFPSAASLGAKVNQKQTSTNYMELLTQDKGKRIKRPDLITKDTVVKY
jgi:hypothetical protein